jgi:hypothetical protein
MSDKGKFRTYMYDDSDSIRHVMRIPISYFEDLEDFGISFIENNEYEIADLMLGTLKYLTASEIKQLVSFGKRIYNHE